MALVAMGGPPNKQSRWQTDYSREYGDEFDEEFRAHTLLSKHVSSYLYLTDEPLCQFALQQFTDLLEILRCIRF